MDQGNSPFWEALELFREAWLKNTKNPPPLICATCWNAAPKINEKLPWRYELERHEGRLYRGEYAIAPAALLHAAEIGESRLIDIKTRDQWLDLAVGLERAALHYWFGREIERARVDNRVFARELTEEGFESFASKLLQVPGHRPERLSDRSFIWIMANVWEYFGKRPGTATGFDTKNAQSREIPSLFQKFCNGWLSVVEPNRALPLKRKKIRLVLNRRLRAM